MINKLPIEPAENKGRLIELDGIRGLAIMLVLMCHLTSFLSLESASVWQKLVYRLFNASWIGVDVFFVLSGYLITNILLDGVNKAGFWRKFYIRRALRILPAFFVAFAFALILTPNVSPWTVFLYSAFLANWGAIGGHWIPVIGIVWSLAIEEQFYFVWPQVVARVSLKKLLRIAVALIAMSELLRVLFFAFNVQGWIAYNITPTRLDGLAMGAALAIGMLDPIITSFLQRNFKKIAAIALGMYWLGFLSFKLSYFPWEYRAQIVAIPLVCVITAMGIFAAVSGRLPRRLQRTFSNPLLVYLGLRSYGIYLIHTFVQELLPEVLYHVFNLPRKNSFWIGLIEMFCAILISVAIAEVSWRLIENPAQRQRKRFHV